MRPFPMVLGTLVVSLACPQLARTQAADASPPATWEPAYWDTTMLAIKDAQQRGDRLQAEALCSRLIPYAEAQTVAALRRHADLLEAQKSPGAADVRARAERLAQVKAEQAKAGAPGSTYLGFAPWEELYVYVGALQVSGRDADAHAMRQLAVASRRSQEVSVRRSILMRDHKDPRGEC